MTLRVIHVARGREWRGGEFQVLLLARTLAARGVAQLVVTGSGSRLAAELEAAGVPVAPVAWDTAWDPRAASGLIRQLNADRPALLHAHDSHALGVALLGRAWGKIPVVATRRSITAPGALWKRTNRVMAISHAVAKVLAQAGVDPERIALAPSAVAPEQFRDVAAAPPPGDPPLVVAIGAPTQEKGHATLRAALARMAPPRPALELLTDGLDDALLGRAALMVQPSHREALGTAVLVAMARGIPVIASRTGGLVELLEGDAGVLVPPADPAALAQAIRRVLDDAPLRDAMVRRARQRVEDYRPECMADRVTDVYASVLSDPD